MGDKTFPYSNDYLLCLLTLRVDIQLKFICCPLHPDSVPGSPSLGTVSDLCHSNLFAKSRALLATFLDFHTLWLLFWVDLWMCTSWLVGVDQQLLLKQMEGTGTDWEKDHFPGVHGNSGQFSELSKMSTTFFVLHWGLWPSLLITILCNSLSKTLCVLTAAFQSGWWKHWVRGLQRVLGRVHAEEADPRSPWVLSTIIDLGNQATGLRILTGFLLLRACWQWIWCLHSFNLLDYEPHS